MKFEFIKHLHMWYLIPTLGFRWWGLKTTRYFVITLTWLCFTMDVDVTNYHNTICNTNWR